VRYTIQTSGTVTGGSFTLRIATGPSGGGQTYDATIPFNATAAQIKALIEGLPNMKDGSVAAGDAGAAGPLPGTPVALYFEGMGKQAPRVVSIGANNLTGTTPGVTVTEDTTARYDKPGRNDTGSVATRAAAGAWGN
jgi:hypothetical protein